MAPAPELDDALRRARVLWVALGAAAPRALWHVWHDDAVHVVVGRGEQHLPGAADAERAVVLVRGGGALGGRVGELACSVERLEPGTPDWDEVVPLLAGRRLNGPAPDELQAQWARHAMVLRLRPG